MKTWIAVGALLASSLIGILAADAASVFVNAASDNTIYEEADTLSNALGQRFFAGNNGVANTRRGLIKFTLTGMVPAGATVDSVVLRLNLVQTSAGSVAVGLHQLLADWGEGTSVAAGGEGGGAPASAGDATWSDRFFGVSTWSTAGGDYNSVASATRPVGTIGVYTWRSAGMTADVVSWLANPALNYGWELVGDETGPGTAKAFATRQAVITGNRPRLTIYYTEAPTAVGPVAAASRLFPVQPNPFNPTATIRYDLSVRGHVRLDVYDAAGRLVRVLVDDVQPSGLHDVLWHGDDGRHGRVASGVYFARLIVDHAPAQVEKMVLLK